VRLLDDDRRDGSVNELKDASVDLLVTVGILASIMGRFPAHVEETFVEKIENLSILIREEIAELHLLGESYDDQLDNGD
jgi:hypothetical protein